MTRKIVVSTILFLSLLNPQLSLAAPDQSQESDLLPPSESILVYYRSEIKMHDGRESKVKGQVRLVPDKDVKHKAADFTMTFKYTPTAQGNHLFVIKVIIGEESPREIVSRLIVEPDSTGSVSFKGDDDGDIKYFNFKVEPRKRTAAKS